MELKVKSVNFEEKSSQQIEQELLTKHEDRYSDPKEATVVEKPVVEEKTEKPKSEEVKVEEPTKEEVKEEVLSDDDVLSHINKRYNKQINSVDELFREREEQEELPQDVAAYLKYKKETGRDINDYIRLNKNFDDMKSDELLREYLTETEEGLDADDISSLMEDFSYDEEVDEAPVIKQRTLAKKKTIAKAKKYFKSQQKKYKQPLESSEVGVSEGEKEELEGYRQYVKNAKTHEEESNKKREWFQKKTNEVFHGEFKGFEFTLGDKKIVYSPGDVKEVKQAQSTPFNFVDKYIDESGLVKDASGYHRALALAMNPDKFAQFFYEQGQSSATEEVMRKTKNINMGMRNTPEITKKGGMQIKSLSTGSGRGLKIRSLKKK